MVNRKVILISATITALYCNTFNTSTNNQSTDQLINESTSQSGRRRGIMKADPCFFHMIKSVYSADPENKRDDDNTNKWCAPVQPVIFKISCNNCGSKTSGRIG